MLKMKKDENENVFNVASTFKNTSESINKRIVMDDIDYIEEDSAPTEILDTSNETELLNSDENNTQLLNFADDIATDNATQRFTEENEKAMAPATAKKQNTKKNSNRKSNKKKRRHHLSINYFNIVVNLVTTVFTLAISVYGALFVSQNLILNKDNLQSMENNSIQEFVRVITMEDTYTKHYNMELPSFFAEYSELAFKTLRISGIILLVLLVFKITISIIFKIDYYKRKKKQAKENG